MTVALSGGGVDTGRAARLEVLASVCSLVKKLQRAGQ